MEIIARDKILRLFYYKGRIVETKIRVRLTRGIRILEPVECACQYSICIRMSNNNNNNKE